MDEEEESRNHITPKKFRRMTKEMGFGKTRRQTKALKDLQKY